MYVWHFKYPEVEFPVKVTRRTRPPEGINCFEKDSPEFHQMKALGFNEDGSVTQIGVVNTGGKWKNRIIEAASKIKF